MVAVFAALSNCVARPSATVYDLTEEFSYSRVACESAELVIGTDGFEGTLGDGWSYGEVDRGRNRTFRWGTRPRSDIVFTVLEKRDLVLRLEGLAAPGKKAARQVAIEVNGQPVDEVKVGTGLVEYVVPVSGELLERGENRLSLLYDRVDSAASVPSVGERPTIAMAWYQLSFDGLTRCQTDPRVDRQGRLFLPLGSQAAFYLKVGPGASFRAEAWEQVGSAPTSLSVHVATDGESERRLVSPAAGGSFELPLGGVTERAVRLSLVAVGAGGRSDSGEQPGGILMEGAAVVSPAPVPSSRRGISSSAHTGPRPNIVFYLVDTLRADRLGAYGHAGDVSPNIDRFASGATLFENARAQATWTLPSVASVFTGLWPPAHGVVHPSIKLPPEALTLAEILQAEGYATSSIIVNGYVGEKWGLDQGFDDVQWIGPNQGTKEARSARRVLEETRSWLATRDRSRPFFLYLHTIDPHDPYLPEKEFRRRFAPGAEEMYEAIRANPKRHRWDPTQSVVEQLLALYDALVAQNDAAFGETLRVLEREGLYGDSFIVFLSDHGEEFFEHGAWAHGSNLFPPTLHVPLILKLPGQTHGVRVGRLAQHIDLLPTVLDYLGLEPRALVGSSLVPVASGKDASGPQRPLFVHTSRYGRDTRGVLDGGWKLIERLEEERTVRWLLNWRDDPMERTDRRSENPILAEVLRVAIEREIDRAQPLEVEDAILDERTRKDLRALGYLE